jgi:hypothetical protein
MLDNMDRALEHLENTIIVLETMKFGKGFSRTEVEALDSAVVYLDGLKEIYMEIQKKKAEA